MTKSFTGVRRFLLVIVIFQILTLGNHMLYGSTPITTVVLGDIEGQGHRLDSFISESGAFEYTSNGKLQIKKGYRFVFMGDAVDKGPNSLYILGVLTELLINQPSQMVAILGNRDINKLRLINELSKAGLQGPPNEETATQAYSSWLADNNISTELYSDGVIRLKWILAKTMGAPQAFEFRRQEISFGSKMPKSDLEVFISFREDFNLQDGPMRKYLELAQLAYIEPENRSLYVHGGLTKESCGVVPGKTEKFSEIDFWVKNLNQWAAAEIESGILSKGGGELIKYQQPIKGTVANNASVVYGRNFDLSANPVLIPEELQNELIRQGIDTIVVGHTPVGEIPVIISNGKFRIVFVDNSTSKSTISTIVSLRNGAVEVRGNSPDINFIKNLSYKHEFSSPTNIGQHRDGGWVVAQNEHSELLFRIDKESGFKLEYSQKAKPGNATDCRFVLEK